jgi:hypothetical protein
LAGEFTAFALRMVQELINFLLQYEWHVKSLLSARRKENPHPCET